MQAKSGYLLLFRHGNLHTVRKSDYPSVAYTEARRMFFEHLTNFDDVVIIHERAKKILKLHRDE